MHLIDEIYEKKLRRRPSVGIKWHSGVASSIHIACVFSSISLLSHIWEALGLGLGL